jgi:16S rRNA (guanine1207-N2)-methyltransferase
MLADRLGFALTQGDLALPPDGQVLAVGAPAGAGFGDVAPERLLVVQPDVVQAAALRDIGLASQPDFGAADTGLAAALVWAPRARLRARLWIAEAACRLAPGGLLVVTGAKTDGIDALWRETRDRLAETGTATKAHGRVFWGRPKASFDDWRAAGRTLPSVDGMQVAAGAFSADAVDPGSAALAAALPAVLPPQVADLGAGWGWLSAQILARQGVARLHLVEADAAALDAARANIADPRAAFHWADALDWRPDAPLDAVVTNPPFHTGRIPDPALGRAFIAAAAQILSPKGTLWLVANRHLPYEAELDARFQDITELPGSTSFKILRAFRPRRSPHHRRPT